MSEIKVNKVTPRVACGTTQLGDSGDTITIPSGATIQNLGTATGFGGTGVVSWETGSIKTAGFTAVTGTGYFCNTTGGAFTVTLPLSPSAGDVVGVADYAQTFNTDNLILGRNGSNIGGTAFNGTVNTQGIAVTLVYVDATKGWLVTDSGLQSDAPGPVYVAATGGCVTTCGNFKMHTFLSPATFTVTSGGNAAGSTKVDYLVAAGGGGGANQHGGGGGGGGYRTSFPSPGCNAGTTTVSCSPGAYPITVGGGGARSPNVPSSGLTATSGCASVFDLITSAGGGGGGAYPSVTGASGGSGGGGSSNTGTGGAGNTPAVPGPEGVQGYAGGTGTLHCTGGGAGGGGAAAVGAGGAPSPLTPSGGGGAGGAGAQNNIDTRNYYWSGGGGGGAHAAGLTAGDGGIGGGGGGGAASPTPGQGGSGGGSAINTGGAGGSGSEPVSTGGAGGTNSGGGGGASGAYTVDAGNGGSGVVIIRYRYQ